MKLNIQLFAVSKETTFSETTHEDSNTSDLTINIEFSANNNATFFSSKTLSCTCNGSTVSKKVSLSKGGKVSTSFEFKGIIHNLDGSKSVNWNWSIATGTSVLGTLTDSGSFDLTHYQRNSTFDKTNWSTAEIPIETPKTVTIKQNRSDVYHKLLYRFIDKNENVWKTFATRNNPTLTNSQYTINYSAEELSEFYSNCSSKWSSLISIELYTYTDADLTKQLGETDTVWYVGTIVNATPEIKNCSVEDSLDLTSITGSTSRLIRYVSKPKLSWEKDIKKGATLVSQLLNGANAVSPVIKDWSDTYLLQIIDSRGQSTSHVFNLDPAQNENVVPYIPLTIALDADRPLPTTGEIKLDIKGSFYPGKFKADGPNNTITVNYCIREQGTTNWETSTIECSVENNSYTGSITLSNRDYQKNFEVYAYVSDMIGTAYNGTADNPKIVSKGEPVLALSDELAEIFGKLIVNGNINAENLDISNSINVTENLTVNKLLRGGIANRNTTDTWMPVIREGYFDYTLRKFATNVVHTNHPTDQDCLATLSFLSYWNGAYGSGGASNLSRCASGEIASKEYVNAQPVLWEGAWYMNASHTATLNQTISSQKTGIVLVWQRYTSSTVRDYDINYTFIPKYSATNLSGVGVVCHLSDSTAGVFATKYIYVYDTYLKGNAVNDNGATKRNSGITTTNNGWVLTKVLGV